LHVIQTKLNREQKLSVCLGPSTSCAAGLRSTNWAVFVFFLGMVLSDQVILGKVGQQEVLDQLTCGPLPEGKEADGKDDNIDCIT
jgi:hypothetical protein